MEQLKEQLDVAFEGVVIANKLYNRMDFECEDKKDKANAQKLIRLYTDQVASFKRAGVEAITALCNEHNEAIKEAKTCMNPPKKVHDRDSSPPRKKK